MRLNQQFELQWPLGPQIVVRQAVHPHPMRNGPLPPVQVLETLCFCAIFLFDLSLKHQLLAICILHLKNLMQQKKIMQQKLDEDDEDVAKPAAKSKEGFCISSR